MRTTKQTIILYAIAVLLLFVAWRVLSLGLADHYAKENPARALFWRDNHPLALFQMAEQHAKLKQWPEAQALAKRALLANPLDGRALRILAQSEDAQGNTKNAEVLFKKASILAPRDALTHFWLLDYALKTKQAELAVKHLDALLRLQPSLLEKLQPQADLLAVNPATQKYMVQALSKLPPWRAPFLSGFSNAKYSLDSMALLYNGISKSSSLELPEYQPWLQRLINEKRYMQAYVSWANMIPKSQRAYMGNVFDGGFEIPQEEQQGQFAWMSYPVKGANIYWTNANGMTGEYAFYVEFEGIRTPFSNLQQVLTLPAGKWQLKFRAKANRLDTSRGLVWRVSCLNDGSTLAESQPMRGIFNWKPMQLDFEVPERCTGQSLLLTIPARIEAETLIRGELWLDDFSIEALNNKL